MWLVFSILPTFLYAITNHIDKQILDRYFKVGGVETLLLFSTLLSFVVMPYAYFRDPSVLTIEFQHMLIMYCVGVLNVTLLYCYFKAMAEEAPTVVIIYYQLVPVIALGMGQLVLGETITFIQVQAMVVIIAGTTLASFERTTLKKLRFKWRTLGYMLIAAFCWAGETTIGKIVVLNESVYHSIFWESIALMTIGALFFLFVPFYRQQFIKAFKTNSKGIISLNITNEVLYGIGNAVITHAVRLKQVALVLLLQPMQAIFVFIIGIFLTIFFPKIYNEDMSTFNIAMKVAAIVVTAIGTLMLALDMGVNQWDGIL